MFFTTKYGLLGIGLHTLLTLYFSASNIFNGLRNQTLFSIREVLIICTEYCLRSYFDQTGSLLDFLLSKFT